MADPVRESVHVPGRGDFSVLRWAEDSDKPLLVFSHATGFNGLTYRSLLAPLAEEFRMISVDHRGHGMTDAPHALEDLKGWMTYSRDLVGMLDVWGEPAFLSGHSMGATVSMLSAATRPDLVRGMLLLEPVLIPPSIGRVMTLMNMIGRPIKSPLVVGAARRRAVFPDRQTMFESYQGRGAFKTWPDDFIRDYVEGGSRIEAEDRTVLACAPAWESKTFTMGSRKVWGSIGKVQCPVNILHAEHNSTMRPASEKIVRRKQPDWGIEQVMGATHFLPMEFPDLVRENLLSMAG